MKIETGKPILDGRYVVYVPGLLNWLEPHIVTWQRGDWYFVHSSQKYPDQVIYWTGPLPALAYKPSERTETATILCQHPKEVEQFTGDGRRVWFCPDCGTNRPGEIGQEFDL